MLCLQPTRARFLIPLLALLLISGAATGHAQQPTPDTDSQPPAPTQPPSVTDSQPPVPVRPAPQSEPDVNTQLPVNWLYGAYIPKDVPIVALNAPERFKLYIRQTYTTPGIYIKTGFFAVHDQVRNSPSDWGDGFPGFAKRLGSNQATNIIQNSFTSVGQGIVGWEPRYDRCRCTGAGPRFRHAFIRNFITYDHSEQSIRPNIMPFGAAFGAGAIAATWNPNNPTITVKGYQSVITQAWVGVIINTIGEFAPDIKKKLGRNKDKEND